MAKRKAAPKQKTSSKPAVLHEYTFDTKFFSSIAVSGTSIKDAREKLEKLLEQAQLDLGEHEGKRLTVGVDVEGEQDLMEIDGEDAFGTDEDEDDEDDED